MAFHTACDPVHPTEVDVNEIFTVLECRDPESTLGPKSQQYASNMRAIDEQSYTTLPACLHMVTRWSARMQLAAQLRVGSCWLVKEIG